MFTLVGLIWYQSEPLEVPYCPNHFLCLDIFAVSYKETSSYHLCEEHFSQFSFSELALVNKRSKFHCTT